MGEVNFQVLLLRAADKQLARLNKPIRETVYAHILDLKGNPRPQMAKPLRGQSSVWRLRVGDYRVLYEINDVARQVVVTQIGHRREIYRNH